MILRECSELTAPASGRPRTVIIGGGTVGLYAARELAKCGQEAVVVESGGLALDNFAPESYVSIGRPHEGIRLGRARNLGGTSNLWGGQLVEFQPADFAGRDWIPDSKWPVTYDEVSGFHQRTYENLGISGKFLENSQVFDHAACPKSDFIGGLELFLTRWLKVPSFSVAYAQEIRASEKIKVLLNHTVTGFTGKNGRITAVQTIEPGGNTNLVKGDCFILASGTIEISRLLLHAANSPEWDSPWRKNTNVGAFFQDHLVGRVASLEVINHQKFFNTFSTIVWSGNRFQPKLRLKDATLRSSRVMNIHGMMAFESSISENLVYLKQFMKAALYSRRFSGISDLAKNLRACGKHILPLMWKYLVDNRVFVPSTSKISFNIQSEQTPLRESRISIDHAVKDAAGLPKVILDWRVGNEEIASIREFTNRCDQALRAAGLASLNIAEDLTSLKPDFLTTLRDNYHQVGGARMGKSEQDGVVDHNLRVFGTSNLYVAGAATFRTASNANTTFTALVLTTRLIEHLTNAAKI